MGFGFADLTIFFGFVTVTVVDITGLVDGGGEFEEGSAAGQGKVDVVTGRVYGKAVDSGGPVHANVGGLVGGVVEVNDDGNECIEEGSSVGLLGVGKNSAALMLNIGVEFTGGAVFVIKDGILPEDDDEEVEEL